MRRDSVSREPGADLLVRIRVMAGDGAYMLQQLQLFLLSGVGCHSLGIVCGWMVGCDAYELIVLTDHATTAMLLI